MNGHLQTGTLGRGDAYLEYLPVVAFGGCGTGYPIGHIDRSTAGDIRRNGKLGITAFRNIQQLGRDTAQRQRTGILQSDDTILGFANGHITGDIAIISTLQSVDVEGSLFLSGRIVLEAGTCREVTRLQGIELPIQFEASLGIGRRLLDFTGTGIDQVHVNIGVGSALTANLTRDGHQVALTIHRLIGLHGSREG